MSETSPLTTDSFIKEQKVPHPKVITLICNAASKGWARCLTTERSLLASWLTALSKISWRVPACFQGTIEALSYKRNYTRKLTCGYLRLLIRYSACFVALGNKLYLSFKMFYFFSLPYNKPGFLSDIHLGEDAQNVLCHTTTVLQGCL